MNYDEYTVLKEVLPLNEGTKEQSDGFLYVLCAQPAPLILHQQTQNVQCHICHSCVCRKEKLKILYTYQTRLKLETSDDRTHSNSF